MEIIALNGIRYYKGIHEVKLLFKVGRKVLVEHQEKGIVGNKTEGYKTVNRGDLDICLIRHCYLNKTVRAEIRKGLKDIRSEEQLEKKKLKEKKEVSEVKVNKFSFKPIKWMKGYLYCYRKYNSSFLNYIRVSIGICIIKLIFRRG